MAVNHLLEPTNARNQAVTFPILKFSHSTTSMVRVSPLPWTHLSGGRDLVAVFEHTRIPETTPGLSNDRLLMRFLRGGYILDEVDLDLLAQLTSSTASASGSQLQNQKPLAAIVVKPPILAIRYPLGANQIRRFQAKFASSDDFTKVLSIFTEAGCSVMESSIGSNSQANPPCSIPPATLPTEVRSSFPSTAGIGCAPVDGGVQPWFQSPSNIAETRPSSTGSSVTLTSIDPLQVRLADPRPSSMGSLMPALHTTPAHRILPRSSSGMECPRPRQNVESRNTSSAARKFPDVEALDKLLPPRRELPFAKSMKRNAGQTAVPKPATYPVNHSQARLQSVATHNSDVNSSMMNGAQPLSADIPTRTEGAVTQPNSQPIRMTDGSIVIPLDTASPLKRPLEDITNAHQTSPTKAPCLEDRSIQRNMAAEPLSQSSPAKAVSVNVTSSQTNKDASYIAQSQGIQQSRPVEQGNAECISPADFSAYLSTPGSERSALVESWVCERLESDEFLALCQDVERVWKRIAFGM